MFVIRHSFQIIKPLSREKEPRRCDVELTQTAEIYRNRIQFTMRYVKIVSGE